jgi:hypothetical protein
MAGKRVTVLVWLGAAMATGVLAAGFALSGLGPWAALALAPGGAWLAGMWRGLRGSSSAGLFGFAALSAAGLLLGVEQGWMLACLAAAMWSWDLDAFGSWIRGVLSPEQAEVMVRRHLVRLALVEGLGLLLAVLALEVRVRMGMAVLVFLGLVLAAGFARVLRFLRA